MRKTVGFIIIGAFCFLHFPGIAFSSYPPKMDFKKFIGLQYGDKIDKVLQLFGQPDRIENHDNKLVFYTYYYKIEDKEFLYFRFYRESRKIYVINLRMVSGLTELSDYFKIHKVNEDKISLLGMTREAIREHVGKPAYDSLEKYIYQFPDYHVTFDFDHINHNVSEVTIHWFEE